MLKLAWNLLKYSKWNLDLFYYVEVTFYSSSEHTIIKINYWGGTSYFVVLKYLLIDFLLVGRKNNSSLYWENRATTQVCSQNQCHQEGTNGLPVPLGVMTWEDTNIAHVVTHLEVHNLDLITRKQTDLNGECSMKKEKRGLLWICVWTMQSTYIEF